MKTIQKVSCVLLSCLIFFACQNNNKTVEDQSDSVSVGQNPDPVDEKEGPNQPKNETHESNVDGDGAAFIKAAGAGGTMEVIMGKVAMEKAKDAKVKAFAAKMVADHTKVNEELKVIAKKHGILVPEELPADQKTHLESMKQMNGKEFDRHYMDMMVKDHEKTLKLFRSASSLNKEVKDFASRTLPVLEEHDRQAKEIQKALK